VWMESGGVAQALRRATIRNVTGISSI